VVFGVFSVLCDEVEKAESIYQTGNVHFEHPNTPSTPATFARTLVDQQLQPRGYQPACMRSITIDCNIQETGRSIDMEPTRTFKWLRSWRRFAGPQFRGGGHHAGAKEASHRADPPPPASTPEEASGQTSCRRRRGQCTTDASII
jgi:transposase-like protein